MQAYYESVCIANASPSATTHDPHLYNLLLSAGLRGAARDYRLATRQSPSLRAFACMRLGKIVDAMQVYLRTPKRVNFRTGVCTDVYSKEMRDLERLFWHRAHNFHTSHDTCTNCGAALEAAQSCQVCFTDTKVFGNSYADVSRTNYTSKYLYFRRHHFYECLILFQGKHPANIDEKIILRLKKQTARCRGPITKAAIVAWLKEMNLTKHYEQVHLLYSILTNIPCPSLAHLEQVLVQDFDSFLCEYTKICAEDGSVKVRKNFINIQYVLFHFLSRHQFACSQEDFILPRTHEIRKFYDNICAKIFKNLGWNFNALK
jgi:hypothetical protein